MLIMLKKSISYYQIWKQLCCLIFLWKHDRFFQYSLKKVENLKRAKNKDLFEITQMLHVPLNLSVPVKSDLKLAYNAEN